MVIETDQPIPEEAVRWLEHLEGVLKVTYINAQEGDKMAFQSFQEILKLCEKENWEFWEAVARDDQNERGVPPDEAF